MASQNDSKTSGLGTLAPVMFRPPPNTLSTGAAYDIWWRQLKMAVLQLQPSMQFAFTSTLDVTAWQTKQGKHSSYFLDTALYYYVVKCLPEEMYKQYLAINPNAEEPSTDTHYSSNAILTWLQKRYQVYPPQQVAIEQTQLLALRINGNDFDAYHHKIMEHVGNLLKMKQKYPEDTLIAHIMENVLPKGSQFAALRGRMDDLQATN